jgi:hypothetical protein
MNKITFLSILVLLFFSCKTSRSISNSVSSNGGDGSSFEKAIIINKTNEMDGIAAEYDWIKNHYSGYINLGQELAYNKDKPYDIIKIKTAEGQCKSIYFDISAFFGKF